MGQAPTFVMPEGLLDLQAALRTEWPARRAALHASGVPLNEGEEEEEAAAKAAAEAKAKADAEAAATKPPWGDEKDFDPDKAWKLIQNVRSDADKAKADRDALAKKVKEHEDASKTDAEKREERATEAEKQAAAATLEAARLRVALKKGLTEMQAKRLVGSSEEELEKDADDLLASFTSDEGDEGQVRRRPTERLRPGAAPSAEPEETDPAKLAAKVPRPY